MSVELTAMADSWVNDRLENRDKNFNGRGLGIGRWTWLNRSFVKFDLRDVPVDPEEISAAELRLYGRALFTPLVVEAHYTATGWGETTVTWNNQPPPTTHHWPGGDTSLVGKTTNVPTVVGWFSLPMEIEFLRHRWGKTLSMILKGYEGAVDSYCYAEDREASAGAYAPAIFPAPVFPDLSQLLIYVGSSLPLIFTGGVVAAQELKKFKMI